MGTLWINATFYTMESEGESIEAIFVKDGLIKAVGLKEQLLHRYKQEITETIDLEGAFVYPGFVDSHLHMIGHGEKLLRLDLSEVYSSNEMYELLKKQANRDDKWIIGDGWNENNFVERKIFHCSELDLISNEKPMILSRVCRHAALVNSKALELAGITKDTPNPDGGVIVKDIQGQPTGLLLDEAVELVKRVMPNVQMLYIEKALRLAVDDMLAHGLVGGHTEDLAYYGDPLGTLSVFEQVIEQGEQKFRAHLLVNHKAVEQVGAINLRREGRYVETGALKIFADGALGGRTALLSHPYTDDPSTSGVAIHTQEQLNDLVKLARENNMNVAIHVIGDGALEMTLNAIEAFPATSGRDRLIHVQVARKDLRERMKKLPVILDVQPRFVASDFPWVQERLGMERLKESFAWKTLLNDGLACAGGSDAPIEPVDPLLGIHAAITRRKPEEGHQGYNPNERLTPFEAVQLFTTGSAYAINRENFFGKLREGYVADMTVLSKDLFQIEPDEILKAEVLKTIVDGQIMYSKE
ncbi:amidohydrolase [Alkalihalobacillus sp. 1P02AB]|uniref:amidohydrolase n=1 Tax=Alkalihalobacillus sp. 1P02AB TaxID=3132260 RepID=UPI0039A74490